MAEERKDRKDMTHAEAIADHFRILGRPNPFAVAHSGTPAQRKGGLGSNKGAARYQNTSAEDRRKANTDGRFGYFDEVNKRYVPAIFDMMDGGGRDTRGDEFKGGIFSGLLNDLGVKPYGSQMERAMVSPSTSPIVQAVNAVPSPSYATMDMGEAGRGSMPADTQLPYANMNMGEAGRGSMPPSVPSSYMEAGRGSMPADTPLPYATMNIGETGRGSLPNPFDGSTYDMPVDVRQPNISIPSQSTGDPDFDKFMDLVRKNPLMPNRTMEENYQIYLNMKKSGSLGQFM
jgi:hypothetical protein|tara:strand:- start:209 stop:1072 length:864 start_codon:yes stop_codon:yes gene_type:complete